MSAPAPSRAVRLASNAGWNMAGQIGLAALSFWLIPFIIRRLGTEGYALYSLLGILAGYLMLFVLGAAAATVKFVSEHVGAGKKDELARVLAASIWQHGLGALLGAAVVLAFRHPLAAAFFKVQPSSLDAAAWIMTCAALGSVFYALGQCGQAILQGIQRYDLVNAATLAQSGALLGGVALLVWLGFGLRAIGVLFIAVNGAVFLAVWGAVMRLSPVSPRWRFWEEGRSQVLKDFFAYGASGFIGQLAWSVAFQWDKLLIGGMLPLSQLTYYLIPSMILQKFWMIPSTIVTAAFPMLSELHGAGDHAALKRFYGKCSQLVLWLVVPGFVMLMVLAPQFLTLWLGAEFSRYGTWPLRLLAAGYFMYFLGIMPGLASGGMNRLRYTVWANVALAASCLILWRLFIPRLGIAGAALGFCVSFAIVYPPFLWLVNRDLFGMSWREYLEQVGLRPLSAGAALALVIWAARLKLYTWPSFLMTGALGGAVYFVLGYLLLDRGSRENLQDVVSTLRGRLPQRIAWP